MIPWVDVATGSLGQGLPIGVGMALGAKRLDRLPTRVWVICGDSEMAEGSVWEAFEHAAHYELDNLTAILDVNRLGQRGETMLGWDLRLREPAEAFGWHAIEIDGHDVEAIDAAYAEAARNDRPADGCRRPHAQGQGRRGDRGQARLPRQGARRSRGGDRRARRQARPAGRRSRSPRATRPAAGRRQAARAADVADRRGGRDPPRLRRGARGVGAADGWVVALDGEVSNSTYAEIFAKAHPERYFEMYIAEQQLVAAAVGLQTRGWKPFASTFAAFFSRAYDFIRMAAISQANLRSARLARGRLDRRGRALADGAGGHRRAAGRPRQHRPPPVRREPDGAARPGHGRARGDHATCARCGPRRRCCTGPTRSSRSAGARSPLVRRRRGGDRRRRHHRPRGSEGRGRSSPRRASARA